MTATPIVTPEAQYLWHEFVADLRDAHIKAGKPAYRQLAERSERLLRTDATISFSKTTVSRVLNGKAEPRWDFITAFLRTLDVHTEIIAEVWHPKWATLMAKLHPYDLDSAVTRAAGELPPPGKTCPRCGCWVTDPDTHDKWHNTIGGVMPADPPRRTGRLSVVNNTPRRIA